VLHGVQPIASLWRRAMDSRGRSTIYGTSGLVGFFESYFWKMDLFFCHAFMWHSGGGACYTLHCKNYDNDVLVRASDKRRMADVHL
jgi:hypothetical protein